MTIKSAVTYHLGSREIFLATTTQNENGDKQTACRKPIAIRIFLFFQKEDPSTYIKQCTETRKGHRFCSFKKKCSLFARRRRWRGKLFDRPHLPSNDQEGHSFQSQPTTAATAAMHDGIRGRLLHRGSGKGGNPPRGSGMETLDAQCRHPLRCTH